MALIPNDELVAIAWLDAAVSGITSAKVATTLPDYTSWTDNEFYQIMQVGGSPNIDLPVNQPVISINCFAVAPGSTKPPWGHAHQNAMKVLAATYNRRPAAAANLLTMPAGYGAALVQSVYPISQPRRLPSDPSQFAVYNFDFAMVWVAAAEVYT
jgi:hypothetical protein